MIDAHHHLWDLECRRYDWLMADAFSSINRTYGAAEYAAIAARTDIQGSVLVQALDSLEETRALLAIAEASPIVRGVVGWVDVRDPALTDRVAELRDAPGGRLLVGIRPSVQDELDPQWLLGDEVLRAVRTLTANDLVFDLLVGPAEWPAAVEFCRRVPDQPIVLNHLGKAPIARGDYDVWADMLRAIAKADNVTAKISGLVTEADWGSWSVDDLRPIVAHALETFGPHRLMVGSDWPVCTLAAALPDVVAAATELLSDLSLSEYASVVEGTARRVYGLGEETETTGCASQPNRSVQTPEFKR